MAGRPCISIVGANRVPWYGVLQAHRPFAARTSILFESIEVIVTSLYLVAPAMQFP